MLKWNIETVKFFLKKTKNESETPLELLNNKEFIQNLVNNLIEEHNKLRNDLGDSSYKTKLYFITIQDLRRYLLTI
jgi:hypothetical protein